MAEDRERTVDEEMVEQLARLAGLDLDTDRRSAIADQLDGLLGDANRVNRFMDERREVAPSVQFDHPELQPEDE